MKHSWSSIQERNANRQLPAGHSTPLTKPVSRGRYSGILSPRQTEKPPSSPTHRRQSPLLAVIDRRRQCLLTSAQI